MAEQSNPVGIVQRTCAEIRKPLVHPITRETIHETPPQRALPAAQVVLLLRSLRSSQERLSSSCAAHRRPTSPTRVSGNPVSRGDEKAAEASSARLSGNPISGRDEKAAEAKSCGAKLLLRYPRLTWLPSPASTEPGQSSQPAPRSRAGTSRRRSFVLPLVACAVLPCDCCGGDLP